MPILDGRWVSRISAYLVEGDQDDSPAVLAANAGKVFIGQYILGDGFTFDDAKAAKGAASSLAEMRALIEKDPRNAERIKPYLGGEEVNNHPEQKHHRYVIDFADFPLARGKNKRVSWFRMSEKSQKRYRRIGVVPHDYPEPVAEDWQDLVKIVRNLVRKERNKKNDKQAKIWWWRFLRSRQRLRILLADQQRCLAIARVSPHLSVSQISVDIIHSDQLVVIVDPRTEVISLVQSRIHEIWARFFSSSMKDDLRYAPSDCFQTFPFPPNWEGNAALATAGEAYNTHRAAMMVKTNKGLTKTYNRFHDRADRAPDIERLRALHAEMDAAVLRAYGWDDLADTAQARFLTEADEDDHTYQGRLFWPSDVRDDVLARLLALNAERHEEELRLGLDAGAAADADADETEDAGEPDTD